MVRVSVSFCQGLTTATTANFVVIVVANYSVVVFAKIAVLVHVAGFSYVLSVRCVCVCVCGVCVRVID